MIRAAIFLLLIVMPIGASSEESWRPLVTTYCLDCHDGLSEKGGINLEPLLEAPLADHRDTWERVVRQLDARQMPPLDRERPKDLEYATTVNDLVSRLDQIAAQRPRPGRTSTIRRLTRTEYGNAIRDLLALELDVAELLPADESSDGFDNITVGDLSPALLDRYLVAAQKISRLAVGSEPGRPDGRTVRLPADLTQEDRVEGLPLGTRGGGLIRHHFPRDGTYEIQVRLTRDRNDLVEGLGGQHELVFLIDGAQEASLELLPPKDKRDHTGYDADLKVRIPVRAGTRDVGVTFVKASSPVEETFRQPYEAHFNYYRHPRLSPALYEISLLGPFDASGPGDTASRHRIFTARPKEKETPEIAARKVLAPLLRQAWRRPVTNTDVDRLLPFVQDTMTDGGSFEDGIESALAAILVSREFLFRTETAPEGLAPGTPYPVADLDLASRLSFFLWSSLPDQELLDLAERGELSDPATLESQARRMLSDSRADSLVSNFADQWLYLRNLETITPDGRLFPGFDDNLRQAFRRETELLVSEVIREDRSVLDLLRTDTGWLNERLAKHYGIPHVYGPRFRRVVLDDEVPRGGLLRHGSLLTVTSYATRTSPVIRGHWILENLLGTPPPPPPPNVPALDDNTVSADLPIRERLAAHAGKAACASCHQVMDPVGFALENFDAVGRWRDLDQGRPVDATGGLPDGSEFEGVEGLERALLENPERFVRTLAEKLLTYALGRGIEPSDAPTIREVVRSAAENDYRFSSVVTALVQSPPFTMRMSDVEN